MPSEHFTKKRTRSEKTEWSPAEGDGDKETELDGESEPDGESELEGEREADGERDADGLVRTGDGETEADGEIDGEADGELEADGERDALGEGEAETDCRITPMSFKAWPHESESIFFLMSRFMPVLNEPGVPLSS